MNSFSDLVKEAFIKPLRSVLIVDDEYPTWEEILNYHSDEESKNIDLDTRSRAKPWRDDPTGPLQVIKKFRAHNPGFVIDIHDALATGDIKSEDETITQLANHLHQSDLLVLDYNLEGAGTGLRGKKAREILHSVLSNQHFNLIIVHTGEYNLEEVAEECLLSLLPSCSTKYSTKELSDIAQLEDEITALEDVDDFDRKIINEHFNRTQYLYARRLGYEKARQEFMSAKGPLSSLYLLTEKLKFNAIQKKVFFIWAIKELEKTFANELASNELKGITWNTSGHHKWIRTAKGFVCFVSKGPDNLLTELENALIDWQPTPSRLISAKYRHELNRIGVEAEDDILLKHHLYALFYRNIRDVAIGRDDISDEQKDIIRDYKLREHVTRQSEGLSFLIEDEIVSFGKKIVELDLLKTHDFESSYMIDLSNDRELKKAIAQYNNYVATLPNKDNTEQLDSGHIFKIDEQWWVCATPACDLQPGQKTIAFAGKSNSLRPFTAFQLTAENPDKLDENHINGGNYCFVEDNGKIIALGIKSIGEEKKPSNLKVHWQNFVAENGGVIAQRKLNVKQLVLNNEDIKLVQKEATVICKLRYAYALNYIQRVGISASRIGLEYVS